MHFILFYFDKTQDFSNNVSLFIVPFFYITYNTGLPLQYKVRFYAITFLFSAFKLCPLIDNLPKFYKYGLEDLIPVKSIVKKITCIKSEFIGLTHI